MSHITTITHRGPRGAAERRPPRTNLPPPGAGGDISAWCSPAASCWLPCCWFWRTWHPRSPLQKKALPDLKPFLVEDIYPGATGLEPEHLVDFKGKLVFAADHPGLRRGTVE